MLFSSIAFLYVFLPLVLLIYFMVPGKLRNYVLLAFSLIFYYCGEQILTLLLVFSSLSDYLHSIFIEKHRGTPRAKALLISSIFINVALLGFFKYADFLLEAFNSLTGASVPLPGIPLPIGISFFTFQTMSYTIDVYRGKVHAQRNLATLATFVCLFPQLVAGPIVRYSSIGGELESRKVNLDSMAAGIVRFTLGLAKKVLIANTLGELCSVFFASGEKTLLFYWIYAAAFTLQIYFDFSGYSDMAIGLGRIFGFTFPENFNYPYMSRSITEFWRRWHMTLGGWFRDYVYIPLGGNRVSGLKWLRNVAAVWLLTGLWHGAAWNFVIWGLFFAVLLIAEKFWLGRLLEKAGPVIPHIYVMVLIAISFVLFNAQGMEGAAVDLQALFGLSGLPFYGPETLYCLKSYAGVFLLAILGATPLVKHLTESFAASGSGAPILAVAQPLVTGLLLILSTACLVDGSFNPFLYFRF